MGVQRRQRQLLEAAENELWDTDPGLDLALTTRYPADHGFIEDTLAGTATRSTPACCLRNRSSRAA
jgi:hypothetical protein